MVAQMWQQSPVIMTMVSGLLLFSMYSVIAYFRDEPAKTLPSSDLDRDAANFETLPGQRWHGQPNQQP